MSAVSEAIERITTCILRGYSIQPSDAMILIDNAMTAEEIADWHKLDSVIMGIEPREDT